MSFADGFWATVELLVAHDATSHSHPFEDDNDDWLENVSSKVKAQMKSSSDASRYEDSFSAWDDSVDYGNLVDCSFSHSPVKTRLEALMGSNVVRLTDRKYMLKLMARIREDHEKKQEARIEKRKFGELMRTKDLILTRFINIQDAPSEIRTYPLMQLYLYCDSIIERRRRKVFAKKVKISPSLYRLLYPRASCEGLEEEEEAEDVPMKEIMVDGEPVLVPMSPEEIENDKKQKEIIADIKNGYMYTDSEFDSLHYEADSVKKLKDAKTVNEMYNKAHDIVGFLFSLALDKRKTQSMADSSAASKASSRSKI